MFEDLLDAIFSSSEKVRYVGIVDHYGRKVEGGMRSRKESMNPESEEEKMYVQAALRRGMTETWSNYFGEARWSMTAHKRIIVVEFPLGKRNSLLVTLEPDAPIAEIAEFISKLTEEREMLEHRPQTTLT